MKILFYGKMIAAIFMVSACKAPVLNLDLGLEKKIVKDGCSKGIPLARMSTITSKNSTLIVYHANYCSRAGNGSKSKVSLALNSTENSNAGQTQYVGTYIHAAYDPFGNELVSQNRAGMDALMKVKGFRVVNLRSNDPTGWQKEIVNDRSSHPEYYGPGSSVFTEITTHGEAAKTPAGNQGSRMISYDNVGKKSSINTFDGVKSVMDAVGGQADCSVFLTQCHSGALKSDPRFSELLTSEVNPAQKRAIIFSAAANEIATEASYNNGVSLGGITSPMMVLVNESSRGDVTQTQLEKAWNANPGWTTKTAYKLSEYPGEDGKRHEEEYKKFIDQHPSVVTNSENMVIMPQSYGNYIPNLGQVLMDKNTAQQQTTEYYDPER